MEAGWQAAEPRYAAGDLIDLFVSVASEALGRYPMPNDEGIGF